MTEQQNAIRFSAEPELVIPFGINREQAAHIFLRNFSADKMTPSEFSDAVHADRFEPQYFPAYLFDCNIITSIDAVCTKNKDGKLEEYQAQRTVKTHLSEILVNAQSDDFLLHLLEPYDLEKAVEFSAEAVNEVEYASPAFSVQELFEKIKPEAEKAALQAAENCLKNYTDKKTTGFTHSFADINAKQILLPMWVLECNYGGRPYNIFLNGQTGRVAGVPPRSKKKAAALIGTAAIIGAAISQLIWMAVTALW